MKIIVGLGNPGPEYGGTRHNSGLLLVDRIYNSQFSIYKENYGWRRKKDIMTAEFPEMVLVKTAGVFMNESGKIISELKYMNLVAGGSNAPSDPPLNSKNQNDSSLLTSFAVGEGRERYGGLFVAHDDLDIKLGEYKIQFGTGPKVHNGILAVERALGTKDFWRIRVGIDNRPYFAEATKGELYVLQRFSNDERKILDEVLIKITEEILK